MAFIAEPATAGQTAYYDRGFSGGTMEPPRLQLLLTQTCEGPIDVLAVYKGRPTRPFIDFARVVECAYRIACGAKQQFDTTISRDG